MHYHDFKLDPNISDIIIRPLGHPAQTVTQGVDGSIFCTNRGSLYKKEIGSEKFSLLSQIDDAYHANILAFDNAGHLYYAGKFTGELKISRDLGKTFSVCLTDGGLDCFRGFAIDGDGSIYTGSYGKLGPASLYRSDDDGKTWAAIKTFRCRHIHTVAVNPQNNWLYAVTGEMSGAQKLDAYRVFRSKDKGVSWQPLIEPQIRARNGWGRPLYLGIGFINDLVVLSTDHAEGGNGIDAFADDGGTGPFMPQRVFNNPEVPLKPGQPPNYCWQFVKWHEHLYTVCSGEHKAVMYRSQDGVSWPKCAEFAPGVGQKLEFRPYDNLFLISGTVSGFELEKKAPPPDHADAQDIIHFSLPQQLLAHDSRYEEVHSRGYYLRSLQTSEKQEIVLKMLAENKVARDGLIIDVGTGVGKYLLALRKVGYTRLMASESNPRWLIAARHLYEAAFESESPNMRLVQYGDFTLPESDEPFEAILIMGVFVGKGNNVPFEKALTISYERLKNGGTLCFNLNPRTYGETNPDIFLQKLAETGFKEIRCKPNVNIFYITAKKL